MSEDSPDGTLNFLIPKYEPKPKPMPMPGRKVGHKGERKSPTSYEIRMLARSYGEWGIHRLAKLARDDAVPFPTQVECIKALLDRGYGRPEPLEEGQSDNSIRITIRHMLSEAAQHNNGGKLIEGE